MGRTTRDFFLANYTTKLCKLTGDCTANCCTPDLWRSALRSKLAESPLHLLAGHTTADLLQVARVRQRRIHSCCDELPAQDR